MPQTAGSAALQPESQCRYQFILIRTTTCWARSIPVPAPRASRPGGARLCGRAWRPGAGARPTRPQGRSCACGSPASYAPTPRRRSSTRWALACARPYLPPARSCSTFLTRSPPTTERERLWSRFAPCWRMAARACGWCCRKGRLAPRYAVTAPPARSGSMPSIRASGRPFLPRMPRFPARPWSRLPCAPCSASRPSFCCRPGTTVKRDRSAHLRVMRAAGQRGAAGQSQRRKPPSELMTWPVIQAASSVTSQAIRRAGSSGVPQRPEGKWRRTISWASGGA